MRLQATATYKPRGDLGRYVETHITPGVRASVLASTRLVHAVAQRYCPVATGFLYSRISYVIMETGKTIVGVVFVDNVFYAFYVEFGTGMAGASSAGAGPGPYNMSWPGMPAQPYMRPALDESRDPVLQIFRGEISLGLR